MDTIDRIALYSGLNILLTRSYADDDKKIDDPMYSGIPIYAIGELIYDSYYKDKNVMPYQNYIFPVLWQTVFNSLIYKNNKPLFLDVFLVLSTQVISNSI